MSISVRVLRVYYIFFSAKHFEKNSNRVKCNFFFIFIASIIQHNNLALILLGINQNIFCEIAYALSIINILIHYVYVSHRHLQSLHMNATNNEATPWDPKELFQEYATTGGSTIQSEHTEQGKRYHKL